MPCPLSWYQGACGVTPTSSHRARSRLCVPESSPRDTNCDPARQIAARAAGPGSSSSIARSSAGSSAGPAITKSLRMKVIRLRPCPARRNSSSSAGACTSRRSASPRRPSANACPVPTASTLTSRSGLSCSNRGTMASSSPESYNDVVDPMTTGLRSISPPQAVATSSDASGTTEVHSPAPMPFRTIPLSRKRFLSCYAE